MALPMTEAAATGRAGAAIGRAGAGEFALMLLADARLPSGGHTQSAGLEAALTGGMPVGDIPSYIDFRLRTTATVEAGVAVGALTLLRKGRDPEPTGRRLRELQQQWAARTPSHVQRQASSTVGRGYLRMLRTLFPDHRATALLDGLTTPSRPLVLGALAHLLGLGDAQLTRLTCYDEVQTIGSAALKLTPLDPLTTVGWALQARPAVEAVVRQISGIRSPTELPAPAAPLMELWVHAHARQDRRLFSA